MGLLTERDAYLESGTFVPQAMIDFLRRAESQALADGFTGLRLAGEMTWALGPDVGSDRLIEYEALLNQFLANSRSVCLCQYDRSRFDPAVLHDVLLTHPLVILGDQVCPNPFYEPPELVLSRQSHPDPEVMARRVEWRISQVKKARAVAQESELMLERPDGPIAPAARSPGSRAPAPGPRTA